MIMRSPFEILADAITAKPKIVLALVMVLFALALVGMTFITMETGTSTYLDTGSERGILLNEYTDTFQTDSIMLLIESDDVLNPDTLVYIDRLQSQVSTQQYVRGSNSIADMVKGSNAGFLPGSSAEIAQATQKVRPEILSRYVPSHLLTIAVINLEPGMSTQVQSSVLNNIEAVVRLSDPPPGVKVTVTGNPVFQKQMGTEMGSSMVILILVAMILMVIAVGVLFSHINYRFLSVAIVASGLVFTFGIIGFANLPISMVAVSAFPVLIGIGIDYAIQFHARFDEETRHSPVPIAVKNTVTKAGPSIMYAMLATSMGFIAMWISPVPMIRTFGLVCVIGVASCYLAALVIVPTIGLLLHYKPKYGTNEVSEPNNQTHTMERYNNAIGNLAEKIAKNAVPVLLICAVIGFIGFQMDNEIKISTDEKTFVPSDMPAKIQLDKVSRTMGSTSSIPVLIRGDNVATMDTIQWMFEFQKYQETHNSKITGSQSIATYLMSYNQGNLPANDAELRLLLERIPEDIKNRYINGNSEAVIEFSTVKMGTDVMQSMLDSLNRDLDLNGPPPGVTASVTGSSEMFSSLIRDISDGKLQMTILAFILILGLLFLVYRKITRAIIPLVPIVMLVGWNGLILYALGIDYTPMTATLGSLAIGVAAEYTIVMNERANEELDKGLPLLGAICQSTKQIGTAITVSGVATVCGFAALIFSSFNMISNFGVVTVITVGFSLVGAIVVMPATLILIRGFEQRKKNRAPNQ
jgi:hydrophobe/amphiphile efflux-3 (HAE3) family protein